jgi:hypothetical protein
MSLARDSGRAWLGPRVQGRSGFVPSYYTVPVREYVNAIPRRARRTWAARFLGFLVALMRRIVRR